MVLQECLFKNDKKMGTEIMFNWMINPVNFY
jgi:hypothetical protein